jgi:hypothetical protein
MTKEFQVCGSRSVYKIRKANKDVLLVEQSANGNRIKRARDHLSWKAFSTMAHSEYSVNHNCSYFSFPVTLGYAVNCFAGVF